MNQTAHNLKIVGILLGAAVILTLPIFFLGMPSGNDMPQHYRFAIAFYDALRSGDIYPAWVDSTNLGFGDAGVRFYPPLAYYVVALFRIIVPSWNAALGCAICYWFLVGGTGVYQLAREWTSEKASLIAALLFMLMPYHVNQVYNAGLFGEFAGLAILPFCFLYVKRTISNGNIGSIAGLAISYALLVLAHLPLTIIGTIALLIYSLFLLHRAGWDLATLGKLGGSVALAAAVSAFYWVRLLSELSFVKHSLPQFTDQAYDFRTNFLASLFYVPAEKYEQTSLWFTDLLFVITLAMVLPSIAICLVRNETTDRRRLIPLFAVFIFAVFIGTPASNFLWEHIGVLQKIQFPWRLLGLLSLIGSVFVAVAFDEFGRVFAGKLRPLGIITIGLVFAGGVFTFAQVIKPAMYPDRASFESNFERFRSDESFECWWPVWAKKDAFKDSRSVSAPTRLTATFARTDDEQRFSLAEGPAEKVRVATFYYPYWKAASHDGAELKVEPADDGTILVSVPADATEVRLYFERPVYENVARITSLVGWLSLLAIMVVASTRGMRVRRIA